LLKFSVAFSTVQQFNSLGNTLNIFPQIFRSFLWQLYDIVVRLW